jgi:hypothetical protein
MIEGEIAAALEVVEEHSFLLTTSLPPSPQDLAIRLLPFRVDGGAQAFNLVKEGEEIDWVALAKGRHNYKERLERGEVTALSPSLEPSIPASAAA